MKKRIFGITAVCVACVFSIHGTCFAKGRWRSGSEAWDWETYSETWKISIETGENKSNERPVDVSGNNRNRLWYSIDYYDEGGSLIKSQYMTHVGWIDEDKNGNRDGLFYRYYFAAGTGADQGYGGFLATNYDAGDGSYYNEEGIWTLNGEVQTISERPGVEGTLRGLWPGVYWDQYHQSRVEVDTDETIRYYEHGKESPSMIAKIVRRRDHIEDASFKDFLGYEYYRLDNNLEVPLDKGVQSINILCRDVSPEQAKNDFGNDKAKKGDITFSYMSSLAQAGKERLFFYEDGSAEKFLSGSY